MVHGGAGRGGASLPGRAQPATALSHPARLDKGAASQAALRVLELHGQAELDLGGGGSPEASHRPLTSSSTGARRPCSSPQRSFPSCPAAVPAPPRTGKVAPSHPEAAGRARGCGVPRAVGDALLVFGRGAEAAAPAISLRPGAAPAGSPRWQGNGERSSGCGREETEGGGRRRGGWPAARSWVEGRRAEDCGSHPPHDQPLPQHPHSLPPGLCAWGSEGHCIWGHRDADKDACGRERVSVRREQGRCLGVGTEGDLSSEDCRAWAEPLRRGRWSLVGLCSRPSPKMRVRDVLDAGTQ